MAKTKPEDAEILVHKSVRSRFVDQAVSWNPLKTDNKDDVLDLPTYSHQIMLEHAGNLMRVLELSVANNGVTASHTEDLALPF